MVKSNQGEQPVGAEDEGDFGGSLNASTVIAAADAELDASAKPIVDDRSTSGWRNRLQELSVRRLIIPKLIYLTLNMAIYATHNYTAMYFYRMWQIEVYQFGAVSSLAAVQFVGALFWGHLADKTGRHKAYLILCTVLYCFFFCLLELKPFDNASTITYKIVYSGIMYGLSCFFVSCLFPLVDAQVFSMLVRDPRFSKELFGKQRLWGTIGHGLVTLIVAVAIQIVGYAGIFLVLVGSCIMFVFVVIVGIPSDIKIVKGAAKHGHHGASRPSLNGASAENATSAPEQKSPPDDDDDLKAASLQPPSTCYSRLKSTPAVSLLLNPHFFFLAIVILCAGYVRSIMSNFLAFYMQKEMKQGEILVAVAIMFRMISEMAIFFYNKQLLRAVGVYWMLIIAQIAGALRCLAYAVLPPAGNWFFLSFAIELLKGTSTACLISAGVRLASDIAPPGCENTAQSYISGIYSGLSLAVGGALGGGILYLIPSHSVAALFGITFWMGLAAVLMCILKYSLVDRAILVSN